MHKRLKDKTLKDNRVLTIRCEGGQNINLHTINGSLFVTVYGLSGEITINQENNDEHYNSAMDNSRNFTQVIFLTQLPTSKYKFDLAGELTQHIHKTNNEKGQQQ